MSRLPVGSSASSSGGRFTSARAMPTRCCSPPDKHDRVELLLAEQTNHVECGAHAFRDFALRNTARHQRQGDVVEHAAIGEQLVVLEHHAQLAPVVGHAPVRQAHEVLVVDQKVAASRAFDPGQQPQQRALAGARVAGDEHHFTFRDREADIAQRDIITRTAG